MSVSELKLQIKNWEYEFQKCNQRLPSKQDIKLDPKVYTLYKSYRNAKLAAENPKPHRRYVKESVQSNLEANSSFDQINIDINDDVVDEIDLDSVRLATKSIHGELGPTPQANGKVLSIFDFRLTPPDSSPLKERVRKRPASSISEPYPAEFKTPTKAKRTSNVDNLQKSATISEKLLSMVNDPETPTRGPAKFALQALETPQYLAKNNRKFEFSISPIQNIAASPSSLENTPKRGPRFEFSPAKSVKSNFNDTPSKPTSSPFISNEMTTPVKQEVSTFQVSPSPLKTHRFLSKKLSDVFQDFKTIQEENSTSVYSDLEEQEEEEEVDSVAEPSGPRRKKFTQKRTTRNWKIKPRGQDIGKDDLAKKDIHKEIDRMDQADQDKLNAYIHSEEESEDDQDLEAEYVTKEPADTKGMHKPRNNNFQRLKINDARAKAFKRRMRR